MQVTDGLEDMNLFASKETMEYSYMKRPFLANNNISLTYQSSIADFNMKSFLISLIPLRKYLSGPKANGIMKNISKLTPINHGG